MEEDDNNNDDDLLALQHKNQVLDRTVAVWFVVFILAMVPYFVVHIQGTAPEYFLAFTLLAPLILLVIAYGYPTISLYRAKKKKDTEKEEEEKKQEQPRDTGKTGDAAPKAIEGGDDEEKAQGAEDMAAPHNDEANPTITNSKETTKKKKKKPRLYFLDNVKVFLTFIVVLHHVVLAFTGCPAGWPLSAGTNCGSKDNAWQVIASLFLDLNQAYFMPLFFFISAYFTPSSYDRKGYDLFFADKAKRLLLPLLFGTFVIYPCAYLIGQASNGEPLKYSPTPTVLWFVLWLLVFNWVYATLRRAMEKDVAAQEKQLAARASEQNSLVDGLDPNSKLEPVFPFPTQIWRSMFGYSVCGLLMYGFSVLISPYGFYTMPTAISSFVCNASFFVLGVTAKRYRWLDPSSPMSMMKRVNPTVLLACTLMDLVLLSVSIYYSSPYGNVQVQVLQYAVAGSWCVNMGLSVLYFGWRYCNSMTAFGRALAEAAYSVYIWHPLVVVGVTAVYLEVWYNQQMNTTPPDGVQAFVGALIVAIFSELVVWPFAYGLKKLPVLRDIV